MVFIDFLNTKGRKQPIYVNWVEEHASSTNENWQALREWLAQFHQSPAFQFNPNLATRQQLGAITIKCWYSERALAETDIEHFRPKGPATFLSSKHKNELARQFNNYSPIFCSERQNDTGYSWLKFEPDNYRLSCLTANQVRTINDQGQLETGSSGAIGKHDVFPIKNSAPRATKSNGSNPLQIIEKNVLLDPCTKGDPNLITFDLEGKALPTVLPQSWEFERAAISIVIYGLNVAPLIGWRKQAWSTASNLMTQIEDLISNQLQQFARPSLNELKNQLSRSHQFAATSRAAVTKHPAYPGTDNWAKLLLDRILREEGN